MVLGDTRLFTAPFPFLYCRSMAFGDIFGFFFISTANDSRTGRPKKKGTTGSFFVSLQPLDCFGAFYFLKSAFAMCLIVCPLDWRALRSQRKREKSPLDCGFRGRCNGRQNQIVRLDSTLMDIETDSTMRTSRGWLLCLLFRYQ